MAMAPPDRRSPKATVISAETPYPLRAAGARVRLASFAPHLADHGVELNYRPTLTEREYAIVASSASPAAKGLAVASAARRLGRRRRPADELLLVYRLRFLLPVPGFEPARRVDVYDFDDALFLGSILPSNRRYRRVKNEARRWLAYVGRARLVIAGN